MFDSLRRAALLFSLIACFVPQALAQSVQGRVVGVLDGDTITVLTEGNQQLRIRLSEIDAPEKRQAWGQRSKQALSALVMGKVVSLDPAGTDRYGRTIARVRTSEVDANLEQVRNGMAWAYRKYTHDNAILDAEAEARRARVGLWSDPSPVAPWEFRKTAKSGEQEGR